MSKTLAIPDPQADDRGINPFEEEKTMPSMKQVAIIAVVALAAVALASRFAPIGKIVYGVKTA